jgi:O-methyltransferase
LLESVSFATTAIIVPIGAGENKRRAKHQLEECSGNQANLFRNACRLVDGKRVCLVSQFGMTQRPLVMIPARRFLPLLREDNGLAVRLRLLRAVGKLLVPSYRFKWPQLDWWKNEQFSAYLRRFGELEGMNSDRKWMLHQLLRLTQSVAGDTAECGVFEGASSYLICMSNTQSLAGQKMHHVFDSFQGLSEPGPSDGMHWASGDMQCEISQVKKALDGFDVTLHAGWIPDRFAEVTIRKFSFVHIDVDLAKPTRESLAFFHPLMEKGGIILCDDYGFSTCRGATEAIDDYLRDKPEKMLALPDGGGFLIRNTPTADPPGLLRAGGERERTER